MLSAYTFSVAANTPFPTSFEGEAESLECNRCKEETAALDTVLQEAKQISELHTAGEFVDARRNTESLENQHKIICQQVFV